MTPQNKSQINSSNASLGHRSYLHEIQEKLSEGASKRELLRLVCLELISILEEHRQIMEAISPSRFHRRKKALFQHAQRLVGQSRRVSMLGRFIKSHLPDPDSTDLEGKLTGIVNKIAELAVDCLKQTVPNHGLVVETWTRLFFHELAEKQKDIFSAIDN